MQLTSYTPSLLTESLLGQKNKNELNNESEKAANHPHPKQQETDVASDSETQAK